MIWYFSLYGIVVLFIACIAIDKKYELIYANIILILLIVFSGFREFVGIDYNNYVSIYNHSYYGSEIGFKYLLDFFNYIGAAPQFFFLVFSVFTNFFVFNFICRYRNIISIAIPILIYLCVISFYLNSFNAVRQCLSVSIFLYATKYIQEGKFFRYSSAIILASFFSHASAIFFLPLYFLLRAPMTISIKFILIVLSVLVGVYASQIISFTPYSYYIERLDSFTTKTGFSVYAFFVISIIIETFRRRVNKNQYSEFLLDINFISLCMIIVLLLQEQSTLILMFKRIHNYMLSMYLVLIPYLLNHMNFSFSTKVVLFFKLFIFFSMLYFATIIFTGERMNLVPYNFNVNVF